MVDKRLQKGLNCRSFNVLTLFRVLEDEELNCYEKGLYVRIVNGPTTDDDNTKHKK